MLDIIVAVLVGGMTLWGFKRGLIRSLFQLGRYVIAAVLTTTLYPVVSAWLMGTPFATMVHDRFVVPLIDNQFNAMGGNQLPSFLDGMVQGAGASAATTLTHTFVNVVCMVIVFFLATVGLRFVVRLLDRIASLPILSLFNRLGGIAVGFVNGMIIVYVILAVVMLFANADWIRAINESALVNQLYHNNILMNLMFHS